MALVAACLLHATAPPRAAPVVLADTRVATFSADATRQLAHKWAPRGRPVPNGDALRRYTRAMLALQRTPQTYGVGVLQDDTHLSLFVLSRTNGADTVHAILWRADATADALAAPSPPPPERRTAVRALQTFHRTAVGTAVPLVAGRDLEWEDRRQFLE